MFDLNQDNGQNNGCFLLFEIAWRKLKEKAMRLGLFDCNGTILDDMALVNDCRNRANVEFGGREMTIAEYAQSYARHNGDYNKVYQDAGVPATADQKGLNTVFLTEYQKRAGEVRMFDGVPETLRTLRNAGIILGLVTHAPDFMVLPLMKKFGIDRHFTMLSFCEMDKVATIGRLVKEAGVALEECFYMGDFPSDVEAANKAGVVSVAFHTGYFPIDLFFQAAPTHFIWGKNFSHILRRVKDMRSPISSL